MGLCHDTFAVISSKLHKYYCLYLWAIHFFENEKKICDAFLRKYLSKEDSGPKP